MFDIRFLKYIIESQWLACKFWRQFLGHAAVATFGEQSDVIETFITKINLDLVFYLPQETASGHYIVLPKFDFL